MTWGGAETAQPTRPWPRVLTRALGTLAETMEQLTPLLLDTSEAGPLRRDGDLLPNERAALRSMIGSLRWVSAQSERLADALEARTTEAVETRQVPATAAPLAPRDSIPASRGPWSAW